jgi:hypothetical protein
MSIWAVKLSTWIDKKDKTCDYRRFVKSFTKMKMKCRHKPCTNKLGYGMVDLHSAPFGMMDGPFCREACYEAWTQVDDKKARKQTSRTRRKDRIERAKYSEMMKRVEIEMEEWRSKINFDKVV